jgi:hypothetical protein
MLIAFTSLLDLAELTARPFFWLVETSPLRVSRKIRRIFSFTALPSLRNPVGWVSYRNTGRASDAK